VSSSKNVGVYVSLICVAVCHQIHDEQNSGVPYVSHACIWKYDNASYWIPQHVCAAAGAGQSAAQ
jgi:hypothetical protein